MPVLDAPPTPEDFAQSGWADVIEGCSQPSSDRYATALSRRAADLEEAGDAGPARALSLLGAACHPVLRPDDDRGPYLPVLVKEDGRRTVLPEDFSDDELDAIEAVLPDVAEPIIRARLSDILWLRRRNFRAARNAVDAYLLAAERLEDAGLRAQVAAHYNRAAALAAEVGGGPKGTLFGSVMDAAAGTLRSRLSQPEHDWTLPLFDLLIERRYGDLEDWARLASEEANELTRKGDHHGALAFLERAVRAHQLGGNEAARHAAHDEMAEANLRLADEGHTNSAHFARRALEHLRQVPGAEERRERVHARLRDLQRESVDEYGAISTKLDFGDDPDRAARAVEGKDPMEALFLLGVGLDPIDPQHLRAAVERSARDNPFQFLVPMEMTDSTGRVVGTSPGGWDDAEGAINAMMIHDAKIYRAHAIGRHIEPMRIQIATEHAYHIRQAVSDLVRTNWFVPPGREHTFERGLAAGFAGDFILAAYLLIPQVEHAVRNLLEGMGVVTSGLNTDRRQNEFALTVTLFEPHATRLEEVLGPEAVFNLRTLLVEPLGPNLRNNAMHGLMDDDAFFSRDVVYLWWLVLWLCCQGYAGPLPEGVVHVADDDDSVTGGSNAA
jgi:hypothetical protein